MGGGGGCPLLFGGGGWGKGGWIGVLGKVLLRLVPRYSQQIYVFEKDPFVESLEGLMVGMYKIPNFIMHFQLHIV